MRDKLRRTSIAAARRASFTRRQLLLFSSSMATGAALVVTIWTGVPLWLSLIGFTLYACFIVSFYWSRASADERRQLLHRARVGSIAGIAATIGYDLSRFAIASLGHFTFQPFDTLLLFGRSIAGPTLEPGRAYLIGGLYHATNGTLFAVAYAILFGNRHWSAAIAFAVLLELAVLSLYPRWLDLRSVQQEFTVVSATGHVVYGTILGLVTSVMLNRSASMKTRRGRTNYG
jgi:hypothetical protein